jgi:hypothetical protein
MEIEFVRPSAIQLWLCYLQEIETWYIRPNADEQTEEELETVVWVLRV